MAKLSGLEGLPPEEIQRREPTIYHSVRVYHGNFRIAFGEIGIQYPFETITNWTERVHEYLGKLPDTWIAKVVDVSLARVRAMRNSLGIQPFSRRQVAEE